MLLKWGALTARPAQREGHESRVDSGTLNLGLPTPNLHGKAHLGSYYFQVFCLVK